MSRLPVALADEEIERFGSELDALYDEVKADLGERDERYIRRLIRVQRSLALGSRVVIFASLAFLPSWGHALASGWIFFPILAIGTAGLGLAKILENMEIGHNILHGQWDWLRDPEIQSGTWEWDIVCPADQWKHSHNVVHHTWTNVIGKDRDVGYGLLRVTEAQAWRYRDLAQPISNALLALLFEWGVAVHDVEIDRIERGEKTLAEAKPLLRGIGRKAGRQMMKDYVLWPLMAGPFFLWVLGANIVANLIRNVWTYTIIFCGHFPDGVHMFTEEQVRDETRAGWYVRQLLGSCNIRGSALFHVLSGNLGHQIEHHFFPDMPSNRYPEVAPRVEEICARYGLPYNAGSLRRQFGTTTRKILRLTLPSRPAAQAHA